MRRKLRSRSTEEQNFGQEALGRPEVIARLMSARNSKFSFVEKCHRMMRCGMSA